MMTNLGALVKRRWRVGLVGGVAVAVASFLTVGEVRPYVQQFRKPTPSLVQVTLDAAEVGKTDVGVSYSVTNNGTVPVLLFDQMAGASCLKEYRPYCEPDHAWVYVDIEPDGWSFSGRAYKAIMSRRFLHTGWSVCDNPMPYGRRLGAGETARGSFFVPLPIKERSATHDGRDPRVSDMPFDAMVNLREVEVQIGWSTDFPADPIPDKQLSPGFSEEQHTVWYSMQGGYYEYEPKQQISTSNTKAVRWNGLLY